MVKVFVLIFLLFPSVCFGVILDYDFFTDDLLVTWEADNEDYIIDVFDSINDDCAINDSPAYTIYVTHSEDTVAFKLNKGSYHIKVFYTVDGVTRSSVILDKKFFIGVGSKQSTLTWCLTNDAEYYKIYYKNDVEEEYYYYYDNIPTNTFEHVGEYFTKNYLVVVGVGESYVESEYSPEIIMFIGIPPTISELNLEY
jgi:hypothetical protein